MVGGGGVDSVRFDGPQAVTANLATGTATGQGTDTLVGIKAVEGSSADDTLVGAGAPCHLYGGRGNDTLRAGPSGCWLQGSDGNDKLYGGAGIDRIEPDYQSGPVGADVVDAVALTTPSRPTRAPTRSTAARAGTASTTPTHRPASTPTSGPAQ